MCLLSVCNRDPDIFSLREVLDLLAPHDGTGTGHKQDLVVSEMLLSKPGHLFCPDMDSPGKQLGGRHSHPVGGLKGEVIVSAYGDLSFQYLLRFTSPGSTSARYCEPHLSTALHKIVMRPDLVPTSDLEIDSHGQLGWRGWRNSSSFNAFVRTVEGKLATPGLFRRLIFYILYFS